jgi:hypothetical protein
LTVSRWAHREGRISNPAARKWRSKVKARLRRYRRMRAKEMQSLKLTSWSAKRAKRSRAASSSSPSGRSLLVVEVSVVFRREVSRRGAVEDDVFEQGGLLVADSRKGRTEGIPDQLAERDPPLTRPSCGASAECPGSMIVVRFMAAGFRIDANMAPYSVRDRFRWLKICTTF